MGCIISLLAQPDNREIRDVWGNNLSGGAEPSLCFAPGSYTLTDSNGDPVAHIKSDSAHVTITPQGSPQVVRPSQDLLALGGIPPTDILTVKSGDGSTTLLYILTQSFESFIQGQQGNTTMPVIGGKHRSSRPLASKAAPKWLPTNRTVVHKGASRKVWRSTKDAAVLAVKRVAVAADGSRKARFEKL